MHLRIMRGVLGETFIFSPPAHLGETLKNSEKTRFPKLEPCQKSLTWADRSAHGEALKAMRAGGVSPIIQPARIAKCVVEPSVRAMLRP